MIEITDAADRLTIEDGNVTASVIGTFVVILIAGAGLISCSLWFDVGMSDALSVMPNRSGESAIPYTPWFTIGASAIVLLLIVVAPLQWRNRIVFDQAHGTLRLIRVTLFGTSVRREEPLASIRCAKVTGSLGAFWQLVIELNSGEAWAPLSASLRTEQYQPDQLQRIADQINQFLGVSKIDSREG